MYASYYIRKTSLKEVLVILYLYRIWHVYKLMIEINETSIAEIGNQIEIDNRQDLL